MLKKTDKNSGMSLIEVIVSMLVLSIAVVAVTMSFSAASKINMGSKQKQSTESLMESLLEYAEAGGTKYKDWFSITPANYHLEQDFSDVAPVSNVRKELLKNVGQGLYTYDVRITTDRAPAEYEKDKLNNFQVIQFGGSNSNTILIDASLLSNDEEAVPSGVSDYDETAYEYFYILNSSAVTEHNLIEEQIKLENPSYSMDPWDELEEADVPNHVDRELRLVVTTPTTGKMQLTAYLTYMLDESEHLPAGTSHTYQMPIFVSEMYDVASYTEADAKHLDQIYILFTEAKKEPVGYGYGKDIRLWDYAGVMDAKIFLIYQESTTLGVGAAIQRDDLSNRATACTINMSFEDPETHVTYQPAGAEIYCSGTVSLEAYGSFPNVSCENRNLAATGEEVRIVTTTLDILEAGTDNVLVSKKVTHLQ